MASVHSENILMRKTADLPQILRYTIFGSHNNYEIEDDVSGKRLSNFKTKYVC